MICRLVDADRLIFEILDTVLVRVSTPYWTQQKDIEEEGCRGTIFRIVDDAVNPNRAIATIEVMDVSGDETEPDVLSLSDSQVPALDAEMEAFLTQALPQSGRRVLRWMGSKLNRTENLVGLVTPFIVEDAGQPRQYIDLRFSARGRKMLARGTFDIDRSAELAKPIFGILQNIRVKPV